MPRDSKQSNERERYLKNNPGFTMLELIVVIIVLSVLVGVALPQYADFVEKGAVAEALAMIDQIATAEIIYHTETGNYINQFSAGPPLNIPGNWNVGYSTDYYWCYMARVDEPNKCNVYATRVNKGNPSAKFVDKRMVLTLDSDHSRRWDESASDHPFTPKN